MIIPFQRQWLRSPVFVGALVLLAAAQWHEAVRQICELQFKARVAAELVHLQTITNLR